MESAVYVASVDKIFGCAGAYVHKCNASTGARESSVRVTAPMMGTASITYHAANGNLYWGGWFDPSWVDETNFFPSIRANLFPINPTTMAVGVAADIYTAFPALQVQSRQGMNGPMAILSLGGYIHFAYRHQGGGGQMYRVNPSNLAQFNTSASAVWTNWNAFQISTDGTNIYHPYPDLRAYKSSADYTTVERCNISGGNDRTPVAVEWAGADVYAVCGNGNLIKVTGFAVGGPGTFDGPFNLETVQANVKPFKLRYCQEAANPHFGKILIPCQAQDVVIVWNPATDTGSLETGFDGPCDIVYTPTKTFAVQSGPTGLLEIT